MKNTENKVVVGKESKGKTTSFDEIRSLPSECEIVIEDCPEIAAKQD